MSDQREIEKKARLAKALRDNLKRRKAQGRARRTQDVPAGGTKPDNPRG